MALPKTNLRQVYHVACTLGEVVNGKLETRLSRLCQSSKINMWAKYKPVRYNFTNDRPSEWWRAQSGNCGINVPTVSSDFDEVIGKQYAYEPPRGSAYNEPFRLGDFAGYAPDAKPQYTIEFPEMIYNNEANYIRIRETGVSDTALLLSDILSFRAEELYFIAQIVVDSTNHRGSTVYVTTQEPFTAGDLGNQVMTLPFDETCTNWFLNGTTTITMALCNFRLDGADAGDGIPLGAMFYTLPYNDLSEIRQTLKNTGASTMLDYGVQILGGNDSDGIQFTMIAWTQLRGTFTVVNLNEDKLSRPFNTGNNYLRFTLVINFTDSSGGQDVIDRQVFHSIEPEGNFGLTYNQTRTFTFQALTGYSGIHIPFDFEFYIYQFYDGAWRTVGQKRGTYDGIQ